MELEFDKEIDAILRKGQSDLGAPAAIGEHLDADTIAAFAENAIPQQAKLAYTSHLADCDRCRTQLAFALRMNGPESAAAPVAAAVVASSASWFAGLFQKPNLAAAMGALVVAFAGILGYIALQNRQTDPGATVTQVTEQEQQRGGPFSDESMPSGNSNTAAAQEISPTSNAAIANVSSAASRIGANMAANSAANVAIPMLNREPKDESAAAQPAESQGAAKPVTAAPPPALSLDAADMTMAEKKAVDDKADREKEVSQDLRKRAESRRDAASPSAKMTGPSRAGALQNQVQNNQMNQMSVTRSAGGKTFANRDGAWYDSAYRGQATANYRRGTDEYRKLDKGLRDIADTIGGTVVVVWKAKAYRIQ